MNFDVGVVELGWRVLDVGESRSVELAVDGWERFELKVGGHGLGHVPGGKLALLRVGEVASVREGEAVIRAGDVDVRAVKRDVFLLVDCVDGGVGVGEEEGRNIWSCGVGRRSGVDVEELPRGAVVDSGVENRGGSGASVVDVESLVILGG